METRYFRNLKGSYMILPRHEQEREWEREMLAANWPAGLLTVDEISENGEDSFWYDISGKQALDVVLDLKEMDYNMFVNLCTAIITMAEQLEELLLLPDSLFLNPEYIFVDNRDESVWFCYYPGNPAGIKEAFHELIQALLRKLDHKDKRAAEAVYLVYEETGKEGYSFCDIMKIVCAQNMISEEDILPEAVGEAGTTELISEGEEKTRTQKTEAETADKTGGFCCILQEIKNFFQKRKGASRIRFPSKDENEILVFEPEAREEERNEHPTVLLTELQKKPQGILKYEGVGNGTDLQIEGDTYIIGSDAGCDGRVDDRTISRRHARITRSEGLYFIEDLNSSNGTYVGGELLNCRVKMSLHTGEIIMFADEKFRFI